MVMMITPNLWFTYSTFHNLKVRFIRRKDKAQQTPGYKNKQNKKTPAFGSVLFSIWIRMQRSTSIWIGIEIPGAQSMRNPEYDQTFRHNEASLHI
jgi:hypothetical protein